MTEGGGGARGWRRSQRGEEEEETEGGSCGGRRVYEAPRTPGVLLRSSGPTLLSLSPVLRLVLRCTQGDGVVSGRFPGDGPGDAGGGVPAAPAGGADAR